MTLEKLQRHAVLLANSGYVRWWGHWNYPQTEPWEMAIGIACEYPVYEADMIREGYRKEIENGGRMYWIIERTNDDGSPFAAELKP